MLLRSANREGFSIHAYCLMPDHFRLLVEGTRPNSNALEFVRHFKQISAFHFKRHTHQSLWESSFYDHVLLPTESIIEVARYIWWNPVRKNLCACPSEYSFSGSQTLPWVQEATHPG